MGGDVSGETQVALVTGASKGVGRGIALGLSRAGWDVAVGYHRDKQGAETTAAAVREHGRRCWVLQADVGDGDEVRVLFEKLHDDAGRLDLLVNNAGVQTWASLLDLQEDDWDRTIRTNLKGTFLCTQQAARLMRHRGGSIVNIGSGANKIPFPNLIDYCASKGGIEALTRVTAVELGRFGIRVNCVAPGVVEIERTQKESPDYAGTWAPLTPLERVGQVDDVAAAVVCLVRRETNFITGQTLYVDGGLWTQGPWPYQQDDRAERT